MSWIALKETGTVGNATILEKKRTKTHFLLILSQIHAFRMGLSALSIIVEIHDYSTTCDLDENMTKTFTTIKIFSMCHPS